MKNRKRLIMTGMMVFLLTCPVTAQNSLKSAWQELYWPEKIWVVFHPFKALKTYKISTETRTLVDSLFKLGALDGDLHGGQLDALRHVYWMARLRQTMSGFSARWLGCGHEKSNRIVFKKFPETRFPANDAVSSEMDLFNNDVGLAIGRKYPYLKPKPLSDTCIFYVESGQAVVVKKGRDGRFLDAQNQPIPEILLIGHWQNPKQLVPSNESGSVK